MSERPTAAKRGYNARWAKARATYLRSHPLCVPCERAGRTSAATIVHHVIPHRGDSTLFWDTSNWQGRCDTCHHDAQQHEKSGRAETYRGAAPDGTPLDPGHRWNRTERPSVTTRGRGVGVLSRGHSPGDRSGHSRAQARKNSEAVA